MTCLLIPLIEDQGPWKRDEQNQRTKEQNKDREFLGVVSFFLLNLIFIPWYPFSLILERYLDNYSGRIREYELKKIQNHSLKHLYVCQSFCDDGYCILSFDDVTSCWPSTYFTRHKNNINTSYNHSDKLCLTMSRVHILTSSFLINVSRFLTFWPDVMTFFLCCFAYFITLVIVLYKIFQSFHCFFYSRTENN